MKAVNKNVTLYIADDGKEFQSEKECQEYELAKVQMVKLLNDSELYQVSYAFEATEGRGYQRQLYILISGGQFTWPGLKDVMLGYLFKRFGNPLQAWYGDGFYSNWSVNKAHEAVESGFKKYFSNGRLDDFLTPSPSYGTIQSKEKKELIVIGKKIDGLPDPTDVWEYVKRKPTT